MPQDKYSKKEILNMYIELSVPRTWLYALLSFLFGYLVCCGFYHFPLLILGILIYGPLLTGATNLINMYYDQTEDSINKPYRKKRVKTLKEKNVRNAAFFLYVLSFLLSFVFKSIYFSFLIFIYIFISYNYSAPPLRFKKRFMINQAMLAYGSVFLPFISAWFIDIKGIYDIPFGIATVATAAVLFPIAAKDITDPIGDLKAGNSTIFTLLGFKDGVVLLCRYLFWMPYLVLLILIFLGIVPINMGFLFIFSIVTYFDMKKGLKIEKFNKDISKKYFISVFWHIIILMLLVYIIYLIFNFFIEI